MRTRLGLGITSIVCLVQSACSGDNSSGTHGNGVTPGGDLPPPTVNLTGEWAAFNEYSMGLAPYDCSITQSGNTLDMLCSGDKIQGTISAAQVTWATVASDGAQTTISASSTPDGTLLRGTLESASGAGLFTALKKLPPAGDVTGKWLVYREVALQPQPPESLTLNQVGSAISSGIVGTPQALDSVGAVYGNRMVLYTIGYDNVYHGGGSYPLFSGELQNGALVGFYDQSEAAAIGQGGTWIANRVQNGAVSFGVEIAIPAPEPPPSTGNIPPIPITVNYSALTYAGSLFWLGETTGEIIAFDAAGTVVGTAVSGGRPIDRLIFDGSHFWYAQSEVTASPSFSLHERDTEWNVLGEPLSLEGQAPVLAFDGSTLWLNGYEGTAVVRNMDPMGNVLGVFVPSSAPVAMTCDGKTLILGYTSTTGSDSIDLFDIATKQVTATYTFTDAAHKISALSYDGTNVWCLDESRKAVYPLIFGPAQ